MKKGDLTTKAIGLAIAGVFAGSGLATRDDARPRAASAKTTAGDEKKDKAGLGQARLQGQELLQGQGRLQEPATPAARARTPARARAAAPRPT